MSLRLVMNKPPAATPGSFRTLHIYNEPEARFNDASFTVTLLGISKMRSIKEDSAHTEGVQESCATSLDVRQVIAEALYSSPVTFRFPDDPLFDLLGYINWSFPPNWKRPKPQILPPSGEIEHGCSVSYSFNIAFVDNVSHREFKHLEDISFKSTRVIDTADFQLGTTLQKGYTSYLLISSG